MPGIVGAGIADKEHQDVPWETEEQEEFEEEMRVSRIPQSGKVKCDKSTTVRSVVTLRRRWRRAPVCNRKGGTTSYSCREGPVSSQEFQGGNKNSCYISSAFSKGF